MKKILSIFLIIITFSIGNAQSAKSDKLLDDVATQYRSYDNVSFSYKVNLKNDNAGIDSDIQGDARLSGEKYNVNYMGSTMIFDGKKQYIINREDEQVTISTVGEDNDQPITPSNLLTFYEKGYVKSWDIEQNVRGRMIQYIKLSPIKSNSEYKQILLGVDKNTKHIYNAIITQNNGTKITFTMTSLEVNEAMPKKCFSFNPSDYDGWDIENLD